MRKFFISLLIVLVIGGVAIACLGYQMFYGVAVDEADECSSTVI